MKVTEISLYYICIQCIYCLNVEVWWKERGVIVRSRQWDKLTSSRPSREGGPDSRPVYTNASPECLNNPWGLRNGGQHEQLSQGKWGLLAKTKPGKSAVSYTNIR